MALSLNRSYKQQLAQFRKAKREVAAERRRSQLATLNLMKKLNGHRGG